MEKDLDRTLKELKTDYLDVWLMHFPVAFQPGDAMMPKGPDGKSPLTSSLLPHACESVLTMQERS